MEAIERRTIVKMVCRSGSQSTATSSISIMWVLVKNTKILEPHPRPIAMVWIWIKFVPQAFCNVKKSWDFEEVEPSRRFLGHWEHAFRRD